MRQKLANLSVALVVGGAVVAGTFTSCGDDESAAGPGVGGFGGTGAPTGGAGGGANVTTFTVSPSGAQVIPSNTSIATSTVQVTVDRNTGAVTVAGSFTGLTAEATVAHIHGPAPAGQSADPLITLTVPQTVSGTITGAGTMSNVQMSDMLGGQTYVDVHSDAYPDGEIRAQIGPITPIIP